jgi:hypothetical protein
MSSKGYLAIWAGSALLALAGCDAGNQQQQDPGSPATQDESSDNMAMYEPDDSATGTTDPTTADDPYATSDPSTDPSTSSEDPLMGSDRSQSESGMSGGQSLESMSPDQIVGKAVVSAEGEEIGEVQEVVQDPASGDKFAVVDVGGFLGVGQKSVVIALNELQTSSSGEDRLESNLTRETLQTKSEYTPGEYEPVQETTTQ